MGQWLEDPVYKTYLNLTANTNSPIILVEWNAF